MNNNQFKRFIREKIEQYTNENNLITVYIDTTSNSRMYYVYDWHYKIKATLDCWIGNNECSIKISYSKSKIVSLANYDVEFRASYLELDKIINTIKEQISYIKENQ